MSYRVALQVWFIRTTVKTVKLIIETYADGIKVSDLMHYLLVVWGFKEVVPSGRRSWTELSDSSLLVKVMGND
jgi:hypothetical protein